MNAGRSRLGICVTVVACLLTSGAPIVLGQPRTGPATARLAGIVVGDDGAREPVRRAIVSLSGSGLSPARTAITDDAGRFEFADLPAGRFSLSAIRRGYVTIAYGATRPGRTGTPIVVETGQAIRDLRVRLLHGAVVTGTIRTAAGDPVPAIDVRVESRVARSGVAPAAAISVKTDDRGVYRAFGLPPGDYVVSVQPTISGTGELRAPSDADVDAALNALRQRRPANPVSSPTASPPQASGRSVNFVPAFYPAAFNADDASLVTLAAGEERRDIDITMRLVSTSRIAGTVVATAGQDLTYVLMNIQAWTGRGQRIPGQTVRMAADGSFQFASVPPGRYLVTGAYSPAERVFLNARTQRNVVPVPPGSCSLAVADLTVVGADMTGLTLMLKPCVTIAGRVKFDGTSPPPADLTTVALTVDFLTRPAPSGVDASRFPAQSDGSFVSGDFGHFAPGAYQLSAIVRAGVGAGDWIVRSFVIDGRDMLDAPFVVTENSPTTSQAVVMFTDRHTTLSGTLQTSVRGPAVDYTVIAFTTNREWWTKPFRRVLTARPGTDGAFAFPDVPPGSYYLAAVTGAETDDWQDPNFLTQLVRSAVRIDLGEGERKVQDLRIGG